MSKPPFKIKPPIPARQIARNMRRVVRKFGSSNLAREHANTRDGEFQTYDGKKYEVNSKGEIRKCRS